MAKVVVIVMPAWAASVERIQVRKAGFERSMLTLMHNAATRTQGWTRQAIRKSSDNKADIWKARQSHMFLCIVCTVFGQNHWHPRSQWMTLNTCILAFGILWMTAHRLIEDRTVSRRIQIWKCEHLVCNPCFLLLCGLHNLQLDSCDGQQEPVNFRDCSAQSLAA